MQDWKKEQQPPGSITHTVPWSLFKIQWCKQAESKCLGREGHGIIGISINTRP